MKRFRWWRHGAILALASVAVVAVLLGPISSAFGFFSGGLFLEVQVQSPATLIGKGAAITVPLQVECTSDQADLSVSVTQRRGSEVARGFAFQQVTCEGDVQQVTVTVTATPNSGKDFKKAPAVASAEIFGCLPSICGSETDSEVIAIDKP